VLEVALTLDAKAVLKKVGEVRGSHRSPALCDALLAKAPTA
jgi:hypothetical protein